MGYGPDGFYEQVFENSSALWTGCNEIWFVSAAPRAARPMLPSRGWIRPAQERAMWLWMLSSAHAEVMPPGRYGLYLKTASHAHVPVLGQIPSATAAWIMVDVGDEVMSQTTCRVDMEGGGERASVRLGDGFVEALGTKQVPMVWTEDEAGWSLHLDQGAVHIGYDPSLPELPTKPDDVGVLDFDGDGNPGGTVVVSVPIVDEVQMYLVQHTHTLLDGRLGPESSLSWTVSSRVMEQRTLAATHRLFSVSLKMSLDEERSLWWMVPIAAATTCADISPAMCAHAQAGLGCSGTP